MAGKTICVSYQILTNFERKQKNANQTIKGIEPRSQKFAYVKGKFYTPV